MNAGKFVNFLHFNVQKRGLRKKIISIYICLCGRTGVIVGTTLNSTESGRSQVRSQVAAGAKYGEFSSTQKSHDFPPEKRLSKFDNADRGEALDKLGL